MRDETTILPLEMASIAAARHYVSGVLAEEHCGQAGREVAELLVTELASHAVLYADGSAVAVHVHRGDHSLEVTVEDAGPGAGSDGRTPPTVPEDGSLSATLLDGLARSWGTRSVPGGRALFFEIGCCWDE